MKKNVITSVWEKDLFVWNNTNIYQLILKKTHRQHSYFFFGIIFKFSAVFIIIIIIIVIIII